MALKSADTNIWFDKPAYDAAECLYFENIAKVRRSSPYFVAGGGVASLLTEEPEPICLDKHLYDAAECQYYQKLSKRLNKGVKKPDTTETVAKSKRAVPSTKKTSNKDTGKRGVDKKDPTIPLSPKIIPEVHAFVEEDPPGPKVNDPAPVHVVPVVPNTDKCSKPKEVKEKRNKADKKGRERKLTNKEETKGSSNTSPPKISLAGEVAKARQHIKNSLQCVDSVALRVVEAGGNDAELATKLNRVEESNLALHARLDTMMANFAKMETRMRALEATCTQGGAKAQPKTAPKSAKVEDEDDDGVDLFASDSEEESEEAKQIKEARVSAYAAKKSTKPVLIAKSNIILDVKPWDDETDMKALEAAVRNIKCDGLLWGASKLVPLAYGIHKLQISSVVEDDKVSVDWLQEAIEANDELIQSVDIAAFNKV